MKLPFPYFSFLVTNEINNKLVLFKKKKIVEKLKLIFKEIINFGVQFFTYNKKSRREKVMRSFFFNYTYKLFILFAFYHVIIRNTLLQRYNDINFFRSALKCKL